MRLRSLVLLALTVAAVGLGPPTPASAATTDRWGFAFVDDPTVAVWTPLDPTRQWGSWKTAFPALLADGIRVAPGRFLVRFPQIGFGARGNVHVTPVNRTGHYCEIVRWGQSGADEIIDVQCHKPGGTPDDTQFTVLWSVSSGVLPPGEGSFATLQYGPGGILQSYNSTGAPVSAVQIGIGQYEVLLSSVGGPSAVSPLTGNLQTTAVHPNVAPRRCKIYKWNAVGLDILAYVFCFNQAGALTNTEFTLSYHRERAVFGSFGPPKYFGYIFSGGGGATNFNYPAGVGANSIAAIAPPGRYLVKYPLLGLDETHAQVVAVGDGPAYCHLTQPWIHVGFNAEVDTICFDNTGAPTPHRLFESFTSRG